MDPNLEKIVEELKPKPVPLAWLIVPLLLVVVAAVITILAIVAPQAVLVNFCYAISIPIATLLICKALDRNKEKND